MEANKVLLQKMYTKIIIEFSEQTGKSIEESMDYLVKDGVSDMHCRGYKYLADELMLEYGLKKHKGYIN